MRDEDAVLPIASDLTHPLHARAIDALAFNFEAHQHLTIAALTHRDPEVRRAAVTTVLWEEPLGAVLGLLACLDDPARLFALRRRTRSQASERVRLERATLLGREGPRTLRIGCVSMTRSS